ncbi:MAG: GDSL-type esterase/lipase family protein, partial [Gracilibacteraceae bacterium]|nr:GDSL-type esterase/lipase family protein [Gracilibacteraceae bacterium]
MRSYRSVIRIIQFAIIITLIALAFSLAEIWRGGEDAAAIDAEQQPAGEQTLPDDPEAEEPVNTKIVCFGDSFTLGFPGKPEDSWPALLQPLLKVEVVNKGATYQPSNRLLERFDADVLTENPGRVVIMAGNGDALDGDGRPLEDYQRDMISLVNKAEASHIKPVLILPLPDPDPNAARLIEEYRTWLKSFAAEKGIML